MSRRKPPTLTPEPGSLGAHAAERKLVALQDAATDVLQAELQRRGVASQERAFAPVIQYLDWALLAAYRASHLDCRQVVVTLDLDANTTTTRFVKRKADFGKPK